MNAAAILALIQTLLPIIAQLIDQLHKHNETTDPAKPLVSALSAQVDQAIVLAKRADELQSA